MVVKRKKRTIDAVDREILRHMSLIRRNLTGNQLAKKVNLSPSAMAPRLRNLKSKGIIKPVKITGIRKFERKFKNKRVKIRAPRSIFWGINLEQSKQIRRSPQRIRPIKRKATPQQLKNLAKGRRILAQKRRKR